MLKIWAIIHRFITYDIFAKICKEPLEALLPIRIAFDAFLGQQVKPIRMASFNRDFF
jgi:hypothetical protein